MLSFISLLANAAILVLATALIQLSSALPLGTNVIKYFDGNGTLPGNPGNPYGVCDATSVQNPNVAELTTNRSMPAANPTSKADASMR